MTCAAEIGAIGIILRLFTGWNERLLILVAFAAAGLLIWNLRFQWIERVFGLTGLFMVVFGLAAWELHPDWSRVASGLIPNTNAGGHGLLLYSYFAVGIFSAMLMEYEVHFYSSGAIEEDWKAEDLGENFAVASFGSTLGAVLTAALLVLGAHVLLPRYIFPNALSTTALPVTLVLGRAALRSALIGMLACIGGAAVETALCGAYNVCQFYNFAWGKSRKPQETPIFTFIWIGMLVCATGLVITGIEPLTLINLSIVFGMVVMPFTYYPILRVSADPAILGKHANGRVYTIVGWVFFVLIVIAAAAALPLALLTRGGQP